MIEKDIIGLQINGHTSKELEMRDIKEKMEVSQDGVNWIERYVYFIPVERYCYAVEEGREENFLNDRPYMTERWKHCREIKVEEYRAFNAGEMPTDFIDSSFRFKNRNAHYIYKPSCFDTNKVVKQLMVVDSWLDNQHLFENYEVLSYGEWVPVGVKL